MTVVYELRGYMRRQAISLGLIAVIFVYGLWELFNGATRADTIALLFGLVFVGGAAYAFRQITNDARDQVGLLEMREDGSTIATLWRPFGVLRLQAQPGELNDWSYHVKPAGRAMKKRYLQAAHPKHPRRLHVELRPDVVITDGLRELAPEALAEYDEAIAAVRMPDDVANR